MQAGPRPIQPGSAVSSDRRPGGSKGWLLVGIGAFALAINHFSAVEYGKAYLWLLLFGPMLLLLGVGTLYDIRVLIGATAKQGKSVPGRFRAIATLLVILGLGITGWLAFGYYKIF